jgi:tRNA/rRNA methyltransferase
MPARPIAAAAPDTLSRIRIVLVRPQGAANVGAAARAMKNMGLDDMVLVGTSRRRVAAAAMTAVRAVDVLERARRVRSIGDAVGDCNLVVGTSGQGGVYRAEPETPDEIAGDLLSVAQAGRVAILFGPEHHGLTRDDLRFCHRLICIDSAAACPSINLAQAVLLVCYELRRHAGARVPAGVAHPSARADDLQRLEVQMEAALLEIGFLNPQNPDRMLSVLRRMLGRAVLRPLEAQVLSSLARRMRWSASAAAAAKRAGLTIERDGESAVDEPAANG